MYARRHDAVKHRDSHAVHIRRETSTNTAPTVLTTVMPSPGAQPVEVTSQSQMVESYLPEMTWCVGPPLGLMAMSTVTSGENDTTLYTTTIGGTARCETSYAAVMTSICATILTGLASKVTVSECDQEITFSTECSYALETPSPTFNGASLTTPPPTIRSILTYWLAPWQSLTLGETPSDVDIKVCEVLDDGTLECKRYQEVWEVVVVTSTSTVERQMQVSTTVSGPGTLIMATLKAEITDTVTFLNFSTNLLLETLVEIETTSKAAKTATSYVTKTVQYKPSSVS